MSKRIIGGLIVSAATLIGSYNYRPVDTLVFHCTASSQGAKIENIQRFWEKEKGWSTDGYHAIIDTAGTIYMLADLDEVVNGVKWYNSTTVNVAYIGGIDKLGRPKDTRTEK